MVRHDDYALRLTLAGQLHDVLIGRSGLGDPAHVGEAGIGERNAGGIAVCGFSHDTK